MVTLLAAMALQSEVVSGVVLAPDGRPVAQAAVGVTFQFSDRDPVPQIGYGDPAIRTDAAGRFQLPRAVSYNRMIVATADGTAAIAKLPESGDATLRLRPLRDVDLVVVDADRVGGDQPSASFQSAGRVVGYGPAKWGTTRLRLPSDALQVVLTQPRCAGKPTNLTAPKTTVRLPATIWAKSIGKPAPAISPTDSNAPFDPKSLRGKWVVVDYWATWCRPCIAAFPKWFEFAERNAAKRDRFEILAIHSPDGASAKQVQPALESIAKASWSGKLPPFPMLYDATGETHRRWGIQAYPTTLLIDPKGRLVGETSPDDLQRRLDAGG